MRTKFWTSKPWTCGVVHVSVKDRSFDSNGPRILILEYQPATHRVEIGRIARSSPDIGRVELPAKSVIGACSFIQRQVHWSICRASNLSRKYQNAIPEPSCRDSPVKPIPIEDHRGPSLTMEGSKGTPKGPKCLPGNRTVNRREPNTLASC
jgi:hypothetical protein